MKWRYKSPVSNVGGISICLDNSTFKRTCNNVCSTNVTFHSYRKSKCRATLKYIVCSVMVVIIKGRVCRNNIKTVLV